MIVFDLQCREAGHRFEGWFGSSIEFSRQQELGLVACPECGSVEVFKAPMAPHLARKGNQAMAVPPAPLTPASVTMQPPAMQPPTMQSGVMAPTMKTPVPLPPEAAAMFQAIAKMQAEALKSSNWVGANFADDARAMHYGEKDHAPIHGQATLADARDLFEEGIAVAPILFPIAPPREVN
jgi:hypothetical protein